jgi:translation initiation factor eIF-2B subunit delta
MAQQPQPQWDSERSRKRAQAQQVIPRRPAADTCTILSHIPQLATEDSYTSALGFGRQPAACSIPGGLVSSSSTEIPSASVHPAALKLALQFANDNYRGYADHARQFLETFRGIVTDLSLRGFASSDASSAFMLADQREIGATWISAIRAALNQLVQVIVDTHFLPVATGNIVRELKVVIDRIGRDLVSGACGMAEATDALRTSVGHMISERIALPAPIIMKAAAERLRDGDRIVTIGYSTVVYGAIKHAVQNLGRDLSVVILDARPHCRGRQLAEALPKVGVRDVTVLPVTGLQVAMRGATKVLIGAAALFANGSLLGQTGTALLAAAAAIDSVPVIALCESFKFSQRSHADSLAYTVVVESDADRLIATPSSHAMVGAVDAEGKSICADSAAGPAPPVQRGPNLSVVCPRFDLTPARFVTAVVSEIGTIPPSAVPVVMRERLRDEMA